MNIQIRVLGQAAVAQMAALRTATGGVTTSMNGAAGATRGFSSALNGTNLVKWGSQMQWIGRQIEYNFTLPLLAAGGFAVKWAMENERAFTRLSKVYGDADLQNALGTAGINNELQALQKNLIALSNYFGIAQADAINIAADWAAAGSSGVALARATKLTMQAMVLGELDAKEATEALIAIQSQFAFSTEDLAKTLNQLNMVENQTGVSMGGLIQAFSRAAGVARSAGIDTLHLAAMIAAMTPAAGSAAQAGNALKTIISRLLSPTKEATQVLGLMGVKTTDLGWKSANAAQRLEILAKNFHGLSDGQKAVVSAVVASRYQINKFDVLMDAIINKQSFYHKALESAGDADRNAAQAQRELNAVLDSNPKKMDQIINIMKNASAEVGQQLIPAFLMAANAIRIGLQWFNSLDPSLQKLIIGFLLFAAVLGPVLRYIAVMATTLGLLSKAFIWLTATSRAAAGSVLAFRGLTAASAGFSMLGVFVVSAGKALATFAILYGRLFKSLAVTTGLWGAIMKAWGMALAAMQIMTLTFARNIGLMWRSLYVRLVAITVVMGGTISRAWAATWIVMQRFVAIAGTAITSAWRITLLALNSSMSLLRITQVIFIAWWRALTIIMAAGGQALVAMGRAIWVSLAAVWRAGAMALNAIMIASARAHAAISTLWVGVMGGLQRIFLAGVAGVGVIWRAGMAGLAAINALGGRLLVAGTAKVVAVNNAIWAAGWRGIITMAGRGMALVIAAMTSPWGIVIAAIVGAFVVFYSDIKATWQMIINFFKTGVLEVGKSGSWLANLWGKVIQAVINAFGALPKGVQGALMSVVRMVRAAAMAVYNLFSYINPFARHSPSLVENVTAGLGVVGQQFEVMERKVSSTVTAAYAQIKQFGSAVSGLIAKANAIELADVADTFKKAGMAGMFPQYQAMNNTLIALQGELANAKAAVEAQEDVVRGWEAQLDAANKALDEQQAILDKLEQTASATSDALTKAKDALQGFVDTPITGELALGDAIRQNQLEQKKLQLEMLKMEQAGQKLDDIKNKYQEINGMIELLRGEQASLRNAGAGSEILGTFDGQIAALEAQRDALQSNQGPLNQMNKALDELKLKGEMLDLEKAIGFDALHDEIERASKSMVEMPFDQIMANVVATKAQVDALTKTYDAQKAAVDAQKAVVDNYKAARDAVQASYDVEQAKLSQLRDAYNDIQDAVSAIEDAMNKAKSAADTMVQALEKAKNAKDSLSPGAQNFLDAAGADFPNVGGTGAIGREGGLGDQSSLIDEMTKDLEKQLNDSLASLNPFNWVKKKWEELKQWWTGTALPWLKDIFSKINIGGGEGKDGIFEKIGGAAKKFLDIIKEVWAWLEPKLDNLSEMFGPTFKEIGEQFTQWGDKIKELKEPLMEFWDMIQGAMPILKVFAFIIGGVLLSAFVTLAGFIKVALDTAIGIIGPFVNGVITMIKGLIQIITGVMNVFVGIFTGDWDRIKTGVVQIVSGLWNTVKGLFEATFGAILGGIKGFVSGVIGFFTGLWDTLVGHSIIPDMVNAIVKWMTEMPGRILGAIGGFIQSVIKWASDAWNGMYNKAKEIVTGMLNWLATLGAVIITKIADTGAKLKAAATDHWNQFYNSVKSKITEVTNFVKTLPTTITNALANLGGLLKDKGSQLIQGLIDGIKSKVAAVGTAMTGIADKIKAYLPGSPVKEGPMKGRGELRYAGQKLVTNVVRGINETRPLLNQSMAGVGGDISSAFAAVTSDTARSAGRFVVTSASALRAAATSQANNMLANQAKLSTLAMNAEAGVINTGNTTVINLNGDLVLPNVSSGADAESFVRNLEALASGGRG